jgi:Protein of unknown function (DUF3313)
MRGISVIVGVLLMLAVVTGCAKTRGHYGFMKPDMPKYGFLGKYYERLQPGDEALGQPTQIYEPPEHTEQILTYTKVIVDPVVMFQDDDGKLNEEDAQTLVNYLHTRFYEGWKDAGFEIVDDPGPNTLRFQAALSDAEARWVALDVISTFVPQLRVAVETKGFVTGKPGFVGAVVGEYKLRDAQTGRVLSAGVDRRMGGKTLAKGFHEWADVLHAMDYWRDLIKFRFCMLKNPKKECEAPKA